MKKTMKAAIFDMDGTLLDSMGEWRMLNSSFVREQGIDLTPEHEKDLLCMSGMMVVGYVKEQFGIETQFGTLLDRSSRLMEPVYVRGVPLKPGAAAFLKRLRAQGVKCVIATATPARLALIALNKTGLVSDLDYIFSTDMVGGSKAEPTFYDQLCALIGEKKEDCVMFEDALYAMKGARAAGLGVVGITDATNERDREAIAQVCDVVIDSYDELK
ncbi:MAG: HAD family phosphatase [Clostridia bacterium]|nr:HAD family phosphatase [Clostridia bacterium]